MLRNRALSSLVIWCVLQSPLQAQDAVDTAVQAPPAVAEDSRQLVSMPAAARRLMQQDMLDHLSALNEIVGHMASEDLAAAAKVAEIRMGKSTMGKHRGTGMGPGRFMPQEMHLLGMEMHESASEFALHAGKGEMQAAQRALQKVMTACVACHYSYRTQ